MKMNLLERIKQKKKALQDRYMRGVKVTQQMKAEKMRNKINKKINAKPGAVTAIRQGLMTKDTPTNVMKMEYERRKYEREQKHKAK